MGIETNGLLLAQSKLARQIEALAVASEQGRLEQLSELRASALSFGIPMVAELARQLSRLLDHGQGRVVMAPYQAAMHDALGCQQVDSSAQQALSAVISQRLYG